MSLLIEKYLSVVQQSGLNTDKAVAFGSTLSVTGTVTLAGAITAKSATAVPATASAVTTGFPITLFSSGIAICVTSDVPTHTAPKGSLCINTGGTTTNNRMYINTDGAGTWTAFTTAA